MIYTIVFQASILIFLIWVAEVFFYKFFTLCCSVFHRFCPVLCFLGFANLKLAFSLQNLWAINKISSPYLKSLFTVEVNYFNRILTSLISLWWVLYEGSFQVCEGRWWKTIRECQMLKLGDTPCTPRNIQGDSSI